MGPCPSNNLILCPLYDSFNSFVWFDKSLELPALGGEKGSVTISGISGGSFTSS